MTNSTTAQMVVDLKAADDAVQAKGWVAPGLGVPGAPLGLLEATLNPLGGLAAAGLGWFMPLVSFLGDGLTQLQGGNSASVTSGSQDFGAAGQDIAGVADAYRSAATTQTSGWSGDAAVEYRAAAEEHANGIEGLGQGSNTVASAIVGAGQVVAQAIAEVCELIAEAVAQIVPIMTQAIARAGETFGQSVVEAIPPCVGIAVEYALRIAAKLAALLASGDNLMKLVQGGMAIVELINTALSSISRQSMAAEASGEAGPGGVSASGRMSSGEFADTLAASDPGSASPATAPSSAGGSSGGSSPGGMPSYRDPGPGGGSTARPEATTRSSGAVPQIPKVQSGGLDSTRLSGSGGGGFSGGGFGGSGGGVQTGGGLPAGAGAAGGRGGDSVRQQNRPQVVRGPIAGGGGGGAYTPMPMGAMGAANSAGGDKDHQRKYTVVEDHEEEQVLPAEIVANRELGS